MRFLFLTLTAVLSVLSVTRRAARELGFLKQGVAKVRIEQVQ
jgi:hypothetical protein